MLRDSFSFRSRKFRLRIQGVWVEIEANEDALCECDGARALSLRYRSRLAEKSEESGKILAELKGELCGVIKRLIGGEAFEKLSLSERSALELSELLGFIIARVMKFARHRGFGVFRGRR